MAWPGRHATVPRCSLPTRAYPARYAPVRRPALLSPLVVLAAWTIGIEPTARAADPQPYTVAIAPTGNGPLDQALNGSSNLESLRQKAPVAPFALVTRAQDDV